MSVALLVTLDWFSLEIRSYTRFDNCCTRGHLVYRVHPRTNKVVGDRGDIKTGFIKKRIESQGTPLTSNMIFV